MRVVVLSPHEPSARMRAVLTHPTFSSRIFYLQGSLDTPFDLERCRADLADAAFLLADKMPMREPQQQRHDLNMISFVLSLKSYSALPCLSTRPPDPSTLSIPTATLSLLSNAHLSTLLVVAADRDLQLFVQLLCPENKAFMAAMPDWRAVDILLSGRRLRADQVVCVTELASSLLALSAVAPGASTLCTNLYSTHRQPSMIVSCSPPRRRAAAPSHIVIYLRPAALSRSQLLLARGVR